MPLSVATKQALADHPHTNVVSHCWGVAGVPGVYIVIFCNECRAIVASWYEKGVIE